MTKQLYATNPIHHDTRRYWEKGIEMIRLQYRKIHKQTALRKKAATYFEKYPLAFWFTAFITMPMAILLAVGAITAMCGLLFLWVLS